MSSVDHPTLGRSFLCASAHWTRQDRRERIIDRAGNTIAKARDAAHLRHSRQSATTGGLGSVTGRPLQVCDTDWRKSRRWGNDFRPEYGQLNEVRQRLGGPPVLAFTATAGKEMQQRILASLGIPDATVFVRDVDRPNIALLRRKCSIEQRP